MLHHSDGPDVLPAVSTSMRDLEARIGVTPLDELLANRTALVKQVAKMRALYGPGGVFDSVRKLRLSQLAATIRGKAVEAGTKITEAAIDEQSHANDEYAKLIEEALVERAAWAILEDRVAAIDAEIVRGNVLIAYAKAELGL